MSSRAVADEATLWKAVLSRDPGRTARFVYAVETTGVYCRPSCPSRRPRRENVRFFATPSAARQAGFRSCLRCQPDTTQADDRATRAVNEACAFLRAQRGRIPSLQEVADHVGLSAGYLQRTFKRQLSITPRGFAVALRDTELRKHLRAGASVTEALYAAGYGSSSRFYERDAERLGMAPSSYRRGGDRTLVYYDVGRCRLGRVLVAATARGVCFVALGSAVSEVETEMKRELSSATFRRDRPRLKRLLTPVIEFVDHGHPLTDLPLDVRASALQRRVWDALRMLPTGETLSYGELAERVGRPRARRAVASACARNPVALLVPCHRVVRGDGQLGGYRWGESRKAALLELERERKRHGR